MPILNKGTLSSQLDLSWWIQCNPILKEGTVSSEVNGGGYNVISS